MLDAEVRARLEAQAGLFEGCDDSPWSTRCGKDLRTVLAEVDAARLAGQAEMSAALERALTAPPDPTDIWPDWVYAVRRQLGFSGHEWVHMPEYYEEMAARRAAEH